MEVVIVSDGVTIGYYSGPNASENAQHALRYIKSGMITRGDKLDVFEP